jgi:N-acetyl-anhydromuramyl-L-alanine amidase AmpD
MSTDYLDATWVPADASNYKSASRASYTNIVIHITDGRERAQPVAEMWQEANHGSSAHFVVGQDGTVLQAVRLHDVAWHAHAANAYSVGIEHCARTPRSLNHDDPGLPPSAELYAASAKLVAYLCNQAQLSPDRVTIQGHAEIDHATTHADCPNGAPWDWDSYMTLVQNEYDALQAVAQPGS